MKHDIQNSRHFWLFAVLLLIATILPVFADTYLIKFATRVLIFGMAALAVDILLGYCGLVSFGHSAFVGIGGYLAGILTVEGYQEILVTWPLAVVGSMFFAAIIGAISLRTSGLYFIMITLAFAQMVFYLLRSLRGYGGDDGFSIERNVLAGSIDLLNTTAFYYVVLTLLFIVIYCSSRMMKSRFGVVLQASRDNADRLAALGLSPYAYRVVGFTISGGIAGLAGVLLVNLDEYVSPDLASWQLSGELLVMVIFGSAGTLLGPVLGAAAYLVIAEMLGEFTEHWMAIMGPLLILRVFFIKEGLYGVLSRAGNFLSRKDIQE